jgi:hypothetical protein
MDLSGWGSSMGARPPRPAGHRDHLERHGRAGARPTADQRYLALHRRRSTEAGAETPAVTGSPGVRERAAISNLATIAGDWDDRSPGIEVYAAERGWWRPDAGRRFDFRAAFENPEPRYRAEARYEASCRFLAAAGRPAVADVMRHLRDHHAAPSCQAARRAILSGWSVCMHRTGHGR